MSSPSSLKLETPRSYRKQESFENLDSSPRWQQPLGTSKEGSQAVMGWTWMWCGVIGNTLGVRKLHIVAQNFQRWPVWIKENFLNFGGLSYLFVEVRLLKYFQDAFLLFSKVGALSWQDEWWCISVNLFLFFHVSHPLFLPFSFIVCLYLVVLIYIILPPKYSHCQTKQNKALGFGEFLPGGLLLPGKVTYPCLISLLWGWYASPWQ